MTGVLGIHVASVLLSLQHLSETDPVRPDWTRFINLSSSLRENEVLIMTWRLQTNFRYCKSLYIRYKVGKISVKTQLQIWLNDGIYSKAKLHVSAYSGHLQVSTTSLLRVLYKCLNRVAMLRFHYHLRGFVKLVLWDVYCVNGCGSFRLGRGRVWRKL